MKEYVMLALEIIKGLKSVFKFTKKKQKEDELADEIKAKDDEKTTEKLKELLDD